jgi:hypothetical protein
MTAAPPPRPARGFLSELHPVEAIGVGVHGSRSAAPKAIRSSVPMLNLQMREPAASAVRCASGTPEPPWMTSGTSVTASMARMRSSSSPPSCPAAGARCRPRSPWRPRRSRGRNRGFFRVRARRGLAARIADETDLALAGDAGGMRQFRDPAPSRRCSAPAACASRQHQRGEAAVQRLAAFVEGVAVVEMGDDRNIHVLGQVPEHLAKDRQRRVRPAGRARLQDHRRAFRLRGHCIGAHVLPAEADQPGHRVAVAERRLQNLRQGRQLI